MKKLQKRKDMKLRSIQTYASCTNVCIANCGGGEPGTSYSNTANTAYNDCTSECTKYCNGSSQGNSYSYTTNKARK